MTFRQVKSSKKHFCIGFFGIFTNYTAKACGNVHNTTVFSFVFCLGISRGDLRADNIRPYRWLPCVCLGIGGRIISAPTGGCRGFGGILADVQRASLHNVVSYRVGYLRADNIRPYRWLPQVRRDIGGRPTGVPTPSH